MSPNTVKEHLRLALSEETPEDKLSEIWIASKSVKVRKAIATNPNAGPEVLRQASRLYLEEVLGNPGFSVLGLFDDDPWVSRVSMAYSDPWSFILEHRSKIYYSRSNNNNWEHCAWAGLLSPLLEPASLEAMMSFVPVGIFRRALKSPKLKFRLAELYSAANNSHEVWPFTLETMLVFHQEKVITAEQLFVGLSNFAPGSVSARKRLYLKHIDEITKSYKNTKNFTEKEFLPQLLAKTILVSRGHVVNWIYYSGTEAEGWVGELYCDVAKHMLGYLAKKPARGRGSNNIRTVGKIAGRFIKDKLTHFPYSAEKISDTYNFIVSKNLSVNQFISECGVTVTDKLWMYELDKCSLEVKKFFCFSGCVGDWASANEADIKYKIFNEVNEYIYSQEGVGRVNLLFNNCSVRKVVALNSRLVENLPLPPCT